MPDLVLDASALLALLNNERGAEKVAAAIPGANISAVNLAEVVGKLCVAGMPGDTARQTLEGLGLRVIAFDLDQAHGAGGLRPLTDSRGLSLGDRACLGLALKLGLPAVTADSTWKKLDIDVKVITIR